MPGHTRAIHAVLAVRVPVNASGSLVDGATRIVERIPSVERAEGTVQGLEPGLNDTVVDLHVEIELAVNDGDQIDNDHDPVGRNRNQIGTDRDSAGCDRDHTEGERYHSAGGHGIDVEATRRTLTAGVGVQRVERIEISRPDPPPTVKS